MSPTAEPRGHESAGAAEHRFVQVVLVGFMGAGKTQVGQALASLLGWTFIDSDREIENDLGRKIPEIFAQLGEPAFREAERRAVARALENEHVVVSTGGGWPIQEGTIESVPPSAFVAWLQVSSDEALRRLGSTSDRPLLNRRDAAAFAADLLRSRVKRYALARHLYDTSSATPQEIAERIRSAVKPHITVHQEKEE